MVAVNSDRWSEYREAVLAGLGYFGSIYGDLPKQRCSSDGWVQACCPFHKDDTPSFGYNTGTGQWCCFAGCGKGSVFDYLMLSQHREFKDVLCELGDRLGIDRPEQGKKKQKSKRPDIDEQLIRRWAENLRSNAEACRQLMVKRGLAISTIETYEIGWDGRRKRYTIPIRDESGKVVNIRLYSLDAQPKMLNYTQAGHRYGSPPRLYGVDEFVKSDSSDVIICEGEWDRILLQQLGFTAVTSTHGASSFRKEWLLHFADKDVVVLFDCDEPGIKEAKKVAGLLAANSVASVKKVTLPLVGDKDDNDVTDFFMQHGNSPDDLKSLIDQTSEYRQSRTAKPVVLVNDRQIEDIVADAWSATKSANNPPTIFLSAKRLTRLVDQDNDPVIDHMNEAAAYGHLIRVAQWMKSTNDGLKHVKPLKEIAVDYVSQPSGQLPHLESIISSPIFSATGSLITKPGYHAEAKVWYHRNDNLQLPAIPACPSSTDLESSVGLLTDDLFVDFPFASDSDLAHAIGAVILPFVREMIQGPTPIHLIEAPVPGAGKTLLADLVVRIATGRCCQPTTITKDENETRKKITGLLMQGKSIVLLDNVRDGLDSAQLASALTSEEWSDRILHSSRILSFSNRAVWLVTANNMAMSQEIVRRSVRIRIDPNQDRPWLRQEFKHRPIERWVDDNRSAIVTAVLTIVQSWIAAGRPSGNQTLGSFDSWSSVVGGIVSNAGITGFLEGTSSLYETVDVVDQHWRALIQIWWKLHKNNWVAAGELAVLAQDSELLESVMTSKSELGKKQQLGRALAGLRDRCFGQFRVTVGTNSHLKTSRYCLNPVEISIVNNQNYTRPIQNCGGLRGIKNGNPASNPVEQLTVNREVT